MIALPERHSGGYTRSGAGHKPGAAARRKGLFDPDARDREVRYLAYLPGRSGLPSGRT